MGKIKIVKNLFIRTLADSEVSTTFAAANTGVAQLVEHRSPKPGVGSSSLSSRARLNNCKSIIYSYFNLKVGQNRDTFKNVIFKCLRFSDLKESKNIPKSQQTSLPQGEYILRFTQMENTRALSRLN